MRSEWIFSLSCLFLPLVLGFIHAAITGKNRVNILIFYYLLISVGIQEIIGGMAQLTAPETVSLYTHWVATPFTQELGMANITYGIMGLLSLWFVAWRTPIIVAISIFYLLTGTRHIVEMAHIGVNQGNLGGFFVEDLLMPVILFTLLYLQKKQNRFN